MYQLLFVVMIISLARFKSQDFKIICDPLLGECLNISNSFSHPCASSHATKVLIKTSN